MPGPSQFGTPTPLDLLLIPVTSFVAGFQGTMYTFDPTNFNDAANGSFYDWKVEDVIAGRNATVNRVIISYRDLGIASIVVNLSATTDQGKSVNTSMNVQLGNAIPLGIILTKVLGITRTGQNLQLSIVRPANAGPLSITKVRMEGEVEKTKY